ncbi:multisubstrate pseudouridine synthase 7 [Coemansia spiralis]|uniref:Multisubstrate pseudouridine synthase 7 n=2 Tax=Coemansia TaxID=4863 RepID=A0A9W8KWS9_9FUNG|nr:multisubstrate pseudouridine synthase 7 [Coemansia umbellata]KAJ2621167.1 multisubstrate pseudouridine synthase 7 [Coemansia sp. RSA 1358]KAJ2673087.1 multisubstrate pseudouridine synthase 7 [Coemansia spiralis]
MDPSEPMDSSEITSGKRKNDLDEGDNALNSTKRAKDGEQHGEAFLQEADVGITEYVTPGWDGFDAIIKHRFSDFFVNEIDQQGNVVHLTSYTDADDPEPPMTEEDKEVEQLGVPENPQEAFSAGISRLEAVLGASDAALIKAHLEGTEQQPAENRSLLLDRELSKEQRKQVYLVTNNFLATQVSCETVEGKLRFTRRNNVDERADGRTKQRKRGWGQSWRHVGEHCYFVMQKENHDTMDVLNQIARNLRISPRSLGMAGTKDKRGITVQRCSAHRVDHSRLVWVSKKLKGARLGNFSYGDSELKLGDLGGNQFQIVLRHVKGADAQSLSAVLEGIRNTGFINYYGMQRFGTQSISSHAVGVAVLKAEWQDVVDLILIPRPGDRQEVRRAREVWMESKNASQALKLLPQKAALAEYSILQSFAKSGGMSNAAIAFAAIPRNLRLMYVHAYQSFIWNSAVSERIRLFGVDKAVPGDLVVKAPGFSVPKGSKGVEDAESAEGETIRTEPTVVTSDNASQYSIYDVVLPLPGWAVKYPEHKVKSVYTELMEKDGLSPARLGKHPLKEYRLAGAYRHMVIRPRDFAHEWMRYNDDKQALIRSDSDAIEGKHVPESIEFGQHVALKLRFDLPSSAYATMLLRELMRKETASGHQSKLSAKTGY